MTRLLTVCLGNICRSPTAEAVLRHKAAERGLAVEVDSCGLGAWHIGNPPHPKAIAAAARRGYDLSPLRARQVSAGDFHRFDILLAMDRDNLAALRHQAPEDATAQLRLFCDDPPRDVPDPYYTGDFEGTLDLIETTAEAFLATLARAGDSPG